eukprot:COSAG06_NODE_19073_length_854_cov_3.711258_1_plen_95_part_00
MPRRLLEAFQSSHQQCLCAIVHCAHDDDASRHCRVVVDLLTFSVCALSVCVRYIICCNVHNVLSQGRISRGGGGRDDSGTVSLAKKLYEYLHNL